MSLLRTLTNERFPRTAALEEERFTHIPDPPPRYARVTRTLSTAALEDRQAWLHLRALQQALDAHDEQRRRAS